MSGQRIDTVSSSSLWRFAPAGRAFTSRRSPKSFFFSVVGRQTPNDSVLTDERFARLPFVHDEAHETESEVISELSQVCGAAGELCSGRIDGADVALVLLRV